LEGKIQNADVRQIAANRQHVPVEKRENCAPSTATRIILSAHGAIRKSGKNMGFGVEQKTIKYFR
jgi:hypothetical protein